jgi:dTDP-4-dehydrorhamnose reductase
MKYLITGRNGQLAQTFIKRFEREGIEFLAQLNQSWTNSGFCSRYEWAKYVLASVGINKFIIPVSMDLFKLPAKRPKFSAMSNQQISDLTGLNIRTWEEAVCAFLREKGNRHE